MVRSNLFQFWHPFTADRHGVRAAGVKGATRRRMQGRRDLTCDRLELARAVMDIGHFSDQRLGIGVIGLRENIG